ncbi:MAG: hypothetical protein RR939_09345 [Acinetobacter sp.]
MQAFAYVYTGSRAGSIDANDPLITLVFFLQGIAALYFFYISIRGWVKRKTNGEKPDPLYGTDWLWALGVYALLSLFACFPIFEILSAYGGKDLVRDTWYIVFLGLFGLLTFSRCT